MSSPSDHPLRQSLDSTEGDKSVHLAQLNIRAQGWIEVDIVCNPLCTPPTVPPLCTPCNPLEPPVIVIISIPPPPSQII